MGKRIALNWFQITLSLSEAKIQQASYPKGEVPDAIRTIDHKTSLSYLGDTAIVSHITKNQVEGTAVVSIHKDKDTPVYKHAIELGFAEKLLEAGFDVHAGKVGLVAQKALTSSMFPELYTEYEGFGFRAFMFPKPGDVKYGLIIGYRRAQNFLVSLKDTQMSRLALGKHVVPFKRKEQSGQFLAVDGDNLRLLGRDGSIFSASADSFTLPCRKDYLLGYIFETKGNSAREAVSKKLQVDSMVITQGNRINTNLAQDQLAKVKELLVSNSLGGFTISTLDKVSAYISFEPYEIESGR